MGFFLPKRNYNGRKMKNEKAQVTIFIIIAIVIVAMILIFILFRDKIIPSGPNVNAEDNPSEFLRVCLEDSVKEKVETLMHQGGTLNPTFSRDFKFDSEGKYYNLSYLCYTDLYYVSCDNQKPLLVSDIISELAKSLKTEIRDCSDSLVASLEKSGYDVSQGDKDFELDLTDQGVLIKFNKEISLTKGENKRKITNLETTIPTKVYKLAKVAQEIVKQESTYCHFEDTGYEFLYSETSIKRYRSGKDLIYTIQHRKTQEWFRFIIRGCTLPGAA